MSGKVEVVIGSRYRKLVVLSMEKETSYAYHYLCLCDCGKKITLTSGQLKSRIGSCGCRSKPTKVSLVYKKLRSVWEGMHRRCYDSRHKAYSTYGGRGVYVCAEWHIFSTFFSDMHESYVEGLQLDRIENDGIYCKKNCRWASRVINMRNSRAAKLTESDVAEIRLSDKTTIELGRIYGIDPSAISRIKNNKVWI